MRTSDTWTRRIRTLSDLPDHFRAHLPASCLPPDILYTPNADSVWSTGEQVIVLQDDHLFFLGLRDGVVEGSRILYRDLRTVEFGRILLHDWITLRGTSERGPFRLTLDFSNAVESLYRPIIERFRNLQAGVPLSTLTDHRGRDRAELDFLLRANFKFFTFANMNVPPGSPIRGVLYQPALRRRLARLVPVVRIPTQVLVVTDRELIRIAEEKPRSSLFRIRAAYGAIASYVPLSRIIQADVIPGDEPDMLRLFLVMDAGEIAWDFSRDDEALLRELAGMMAKGRVAA